MSTELRRRHHSVGHSQEGKGTVDGEHKEEERNETTSPSLQGVNVECVSYGGWRQLIIVVASLLLMATAGLGYLVNRLGVAYIIPQYFKRLRLSPAEAEREVASHTFLFIGGPHRGGTTILWKCLREHPSISGFQDRVGTDYSEGMFLQSVYPTFGIGQEKVHELGRPKSRRRSALSGGGGSPQGLGAYGFNPDHHLVEAHATVDARTMLMNEWGYLWNFSRPVLLEKSPPNMLISRFLQRVFSTGRICGVGGAEGGDGEASPSPGIETPSSAKFVFITRHPIANALALGKYLPGGLGDGGLPDVFAQVLHWVVSHEIMAADMEHLDHSQLIRFEDFVLDPEGYLRDILGWIGIPGTEGASGVGGADETEEGVEPSAPSSSTPVFRLETQVSKGTNRKYEDQYCSALRRDPNLVSKHLRLSLKLGDRVKAFGYDLDSFPCVQSILRRVLEEENRIEEVREEGPTPLEGTSAVSSGGPE